MPRERRMTTGEDRYTFDKVVRMTVSLAVLSGIVALLQYLSVVLMPFAAAVVLAYLLNPLVTFLERKTKRRGLAVAATLVGLGVVGLVIAAGVLPVMLGQVNRVRDDLGKLRDELSLAIQASAPATPRTPASRPADETATRAVKSDFGWVELKDAWTQYRRYSQTRPRAERLADFRKRLAGTYLGDGLDEAVRYTQSDDFRVFLLTVAKKLALGGWTVVAFAVNVALGTTGLMIVLLYLVFLLLDYPEYARSWPTFLPPQYRQASVDFVSQFDEALRRYFRGQAVVAMFTAALLAIGFTIIGLPMAVPFGLFVGLLSMVPYLPVVALIPGLMLAGLRALESDTGFVWSVVLTLVVFAVVQVIQDALITPRIMGQATGLRPIAILLGVFVWGKLLGFLGLMLSIPLTCLAIAYYRRYILLHTPQTTGVPVSSTATRKETLP